MKGERWQQVKRIFDSAIDIDPDERDAFLTEACNGNHQLRSEVEKLLDSYRSEFLEGPQMNRRDGGGRISSGSVVGRYQILGHIASGGMGEVYLALDPQLERNVAIKLLNERYESNESNIQRFIQEAKAASALNHPNILTIHEIGETEGSHYIVSEFVEGHRLRTVMEKERLHLSKILNISTQVAEALYAAHSARIVHRDIKPENIVIRNDGYAKVLDFGLAKLLPEPATFIGPEDETVKQNHTAKGLILGTVSYMSPEQAKGEAVDGRTDIFSLGVVIYEMITGRTPFKAASTSETFANLINRDPEPMSKYASGVPDELQRIVSKTLRKDLDERYQAMKGLLADLKELRDRITQETKSARSSSDPRDIATAVLPGTTDESAKTTVETQGQKSPWLRFSVPAGISVMLIGILAAGWYWLRPAMQSQPQIKSLAVLPLKSLNSQEDVLGLGIADAVIRRLSQTGTLTVRPRSAVQRYLQEDTDALTAAKQLATDAVLEGSIQRDGDRLRVSVNLLRTSDGASLWADAFNMRMSDIFTIQDSVSQQVASRLQLKLDPAQQARLTKHATSNPIAYEYYVKAINSYDQRGFGPREKLQNDVTIDLFKKAVEADPNYALAHAGLGNAYIWKALFIAPEEQDQLAKLGKEELAAAEAIDPQTAETYIGRAFLRFSGYEGYQTEDAAREILRSQQIDPNMGHLHLADYYTEMGLEDLADREYELALEVDPSSFSVQRGLVVALANTRRYDEYMIAMNRFFPQEVSDPRYYLFKGDVQKAQEVFDKGVAEDPGYRWVLSDKAILAAFRGDQKTADEQIRLFLKDYDRRDPSYHHATYDAAEVYAMIGKTDEAMKWLRETVATGLAIYPAFERDRFLDRIRQAPEFMQFMAEMKQLYDKRRSEFH